MCKLLMRVLFHKVVCLQPHVVRSEKYFRILIKGFNSKQLIMHGYNSNWSTFK